MLPFTSYLREPWDDPKIDGRSHREITIKIIQTLMILYGKLYLNPWYHHNFSTFDGFSQFFSIFWCLSPQKTPPMISRLRHLDWPWPVESAPVELPKFGIWLPSKTNDYCVGRLADYWNWPEQSDFKGSFATLHLFSTWIAKVLRKA